MTLWNSQFLQTIVEIEQIPFFVEMLSQVLLQFQDIQCMELFFLNRGHTQNEDDSIYSVNEQNIKGVLIYHSYQWITLMEVPRNQSHMLYIQCIQLSKVSNRYEWHVQFLDQ